jgi:hypothetical protein
MINVTMDICGFLNGTHDNVAAKWLFGQFVKSLPKGTFHACPYKTIKFCNMTADIGSLMSTFPLGIYKSIARFYDDLDDNMFTTIYSLEIH